MEAMDPDETQNAPCGISTAGATTEVAMIAGGTDATMWAWLEGLDHGKGSLLCYYDAIKREFDADLVQLSAVKLANPESPGLLGSIDPCFWEVCEIKRMG